MYLRQDPDPTEVVNPDDIRIKRVYTRPTGELAPDATVKAAVKNDIVVEWEAGPAANGYYDAPKQVKIEIEVYDIGAVANLVPLAPVTRSTDGTSRHATYQEEWELNPAHFAAGKPYEITAFLHGPAQVGAEPFQVSFAKCLCYAY